MRFVLYIFDFMCRFAQVFKIDVHANLLHNKYIELSMCTDSGNLGNSPTFPSFVEDAAGRQFLNCLSSFCDHHIRNEIKALTVESGKF